jgi:hypothetical protein
MMQRGHITGAALETVLIPARQRLPVDKLMLVGAGLRAEFSAEVMSRVIGHMFAVLTQLGARSSTRRRSTTATR